MSGQVAVLRVVASQVRGMASKVDQRVLRAQLHHISDNDLSELVTAVREAELAVGLLAAAVLDQDRLRRGVWS